MVNPVTLVPGEWQKGMLSHEKTCDVAFLYFANLDDQSFVFLNYIAYKMK